MTKWKVLLLALLLGIQTLAIAGLSEGVTAFEAKDYATALKEFVPLANQGNAQAQYNLGVMYNNGQGVPKDEAQAVAWYRKAAEQGNAVAQNSLGFMYDNGRGVPKDEAQAVAWYRKAAEQGYAMAQFNLGVMYANGQGVPKDEAQAVAWYHKAAEQGYANAQYNLGNRYRDGRGVPKDEAQAVAWYRKAAEQGYADAQNNLGFMYRNGQGVQEDIVLAYMLYNIAAANGNENAISNRTSLEGTLSRQQITEAQALASAWKPGTPFPKASRTGKIVAPAKKVTAAVPQPTPPKAAKSARVPAETVATGNCRPKTSRITCQSQCFNGDCVVTYANGCKMRVTVASKFNPFNSQWEYPSPDC